MEKPTWSGFSEQRTSWNVPRDVPGFSFPATASVSLLEDVLRSSAASSCSSIKTPSAGAGLVRAPGTWMSQCPGKDPHLLHENRDHPGRLLGIFTFPDSWCELGVWMAPLPQCLVGPGWENHSRSSPLWEKPHPPLSRATTSPLDKWPPAMWEAHLPLGAEGGHL